MNGKIMKIASNDLYGNVDDRLVRVYSCFTHTKYMNNYVVFSIDGDNAKLCYGSVHIKDNSIVIFSVKDDVKKHILDFVNEYMSDKIKNFEMLKIDNISKVELVSYSDMEYDKLSLLDDKAIPKVIVQVEETKERKPVLLYIVVLFLILLAGGLTVLYLKPELFAVKYKGLICTNNIYDNDMEMNYDIEKNIIFDTENKVDNIDVIRTYTFMDSDSYFKFKNNEEHVKFFNNGEGYKFIDGEFKFKLFYQENSVIDDYEEMFTYLKRDGFSCVEREYEK